MTESQTTTDIKISKGQTWRSPQGMVVRITATTRWGVDAEVTEPSSAESKFQSGAVFKLRKDILSKHYELVTEAGGEVVAFGPMTIADLVSRIDEITWNHYNESQNQVPDEAIGAGEQMLSELHDLLEGWLAAHGVALDTPPVDETKLRLARARTAYYYSARKQIDSDPFAGEDDEPVMFSALRLESRQFWLTLADAVVATEVEGQA